MTARERFIRDFEAEWVGGVVTMTELCRRHGISRKTGYKWAGRRLRGEGLEDRSSRPHRSPRAVPAWIEDSIVAARKQRPTWGPRKLRAALLRANPTAELPAASTFALIFRRNGLVRPRRRRRRAPPSSTPLAHATHPNAVWCIDFKGHFRVGATTCYPLTVSDANSRYLIACIALTRTDGHTVRRALTKVFREFGLPAAIRTDNGAPFASTGLAGLSRLSVWWLRLGLRHERIEPGKPQQNGRHERMHLTLKQETASPPRASVKAQQRAFDLFRKRYNQDRPHEALGNGVPADFYEPSGRLLPDFEWGEPFSYPGHFEVVQISKTGQLRWNGRAAFVSTAIAGELVGLEWQDRVRWSVHLGSLRLGLMHRGPKGALRFSHRLDATQVSATTCHQRP